MSIKIKIILLTFFSILSCSVFGQYPKLIFKHLSLNEGLSQSPIFSIKQDKTGFMWIGSRRGLIRYDGYEFKTYPNNGYNKRNINRRDIGAIQIDASNNLWLGTSSGLYLFRRDDERFIYIPIEGVKFVFCLQVSDGNKLWAGTDRGIKLIDCKTQVTQNFVSENISGHNIYSLYKDKEGNLWSGSNKGLRSFKISTAELNVLPLHLKEQLVALRRKIVTMQQDADGDMWFGTEDAGLFWYKKSTAECRNFSHSYKDSNTIPSDFVKAIFTNHLDELWIGTRNGLSILNKHTLKFTNYAHNSENKESLSHNTIWNIMKDRVGSIWLTTYAGGLNVYNPAYANFSNIEERVGQEIGLNQPLVNAILGDEDHGIWAGTDGGGLNYINQKKGIVRYFSVEDPAKKKNSNIIKSIVKDQTGNLLLGTLDGLAKFDAHTGKVQYIDLDPKNKMANTRINALLSTKKGIWMATDLEGLKLLDNNGKIKAYQHNEKQNSLSSNHTNTLLEDDSGGIWIGTNDGLNHLDTQKDVFRNFRNNHGQSGFNDNIILSLFRDSKKRLWLGSKSGLQLFDDRLKQNLFITESKGLANNVVMAITEDENGDLWVSTNNGLSKIGIRKNILHPKFEDLKIINYTAIDGLSSNQWMANAVYRSQTGEIYFGGVNGISFFRAGNIIKNKYPPAIVITDFMIHNKPVAINGRNSPLTHSIESTQAIVLKYNQGSVSFKFAALNFINPRKNSYAYKMEGLKYNEDWNYSGNQRLAVYTGLEPGHYTFKVKATNNDGIWNNNPASIKITVLPPFWLTWWAYTIYTISSLIVFYLIIRFFRRQAKLERDLYYEHLQFERQQELHQMKLSFFTNISHEIRTPLTLIAGPVEKLVRETENSSYLHKQLIMIQSNTNRLLKLVNELMDFRKTETGNMKLEVSSGDITDFTRKAFAFFQELAGTKRIDYQFESLASPAELYFDHNQLEKVLFNLLSNAFKFTPEAGSIHVFVTENDQSVFIDIIDNGMGIPYEDQEKLFNNFYQGEKYNPKHSGTGIGLAFSKSIVELHHGIISFQSTPKSMAHEQQTKFTVALLKGKDHFNADEFVIKDKEEIISDCAKQANGYGQAIPFNEPLASETKKVKHTILVVEDNEEVRGFIMESLKDTYLLTGIENGRKGFETAIKEIPDLIITDVMMPEMDGMELCRKIKSDERTSHIPVILLTARAAHVHHVSGLETGADAYIPKPFSLQVLYLNIRNLLSSRTAMQKKFSQQVTLQPKDIVITSNEGKFLSKLVNVIEERMEDPEFGVSQLATEIGMSQPVLYRKIKALSDLSVADFIKSIRLKKAAMLLVQNKMGIAEVAFAVGFNNRKHFSKEFRKQFDRSPTDYITEYSKPEE